MGTKLKKGPADQLTTCDNLIRSALKCDLRAQFQDDPETIILDELGVRHGAARVDIVVVNGNLIGFELKSDRDDLRRLPKQAQIFSGILDRVTLVVGHRHADEAVQAVPCWWGVKLAEVGPDGRVRFIDLREPSDNPSPDRLAIAKLLWREEALAFLEEIGAAGGLRSKPRATIYARLVELVELDSLRAFVRSQFRRRKDWRLGEQRTSGGG